VLRAALAGQRRELTDANLLTAGFAFPVEAMKTTAAIHWEAVRLWLKGVAYLGREGAPAALSPSHPAEMLGDRENVLVATPAEIHHHEMLPGSLGGKLDHLGQRVGGLERRDDAFEP